MANPPAIPSLAPIAVAVWGIAPESLDALRKLRDFCPSADSDANAFLRDCQALANQLLESPNLKDIYESNASAALRLAETRDQLKHAVAAQARHDEELESLQLLLLEKTESLGRVEKALDLYQCTAAAADAHDHRRSAKIPDPPTFSKGRLEYRVFKAKLQEKIRGDQATFRDEEHQLSYAMGFLAVEAYEMVSPLRQNGEIKTVSDLLQCLDAAYEDPDRKGTAERELRALKQGNGDFTSHYAKFRAIMAVLGWQGEAERSALYHSLSYELKEALAKTLPPPNESFTEYVAKIKLLDDQMRRFAAECKPPGGRPASGSAQTQQRNRIPHSTNPADSTGATPHLGSAPMDLAAKKRAEAQQAQFAQWADEGKCTKCGSASHWRRDFPKIRRPLAAAATTPPTSSTPYTTAPTTPTLTEAGRSGKA